LGQRKKDEDNLARGVSLATPLIERIEKHHATLDASIADATGNRDHKATAGLIGADLKGIEIQAKLASIGGYAPVEQQAGTQILVLMPQQAALAQSEPETIDAEIIDSDE